MPVDLPIAFALVIGRFGNWILYLSASVFPVSADFEYLDALPGVPKCKINFVADMRRWSPFMDEFANQFFAAFNFEFGERHDWQAPNAEQIALIGSKSDTAGW